MTNVFAIGSYSVHGENHNGLGACDGNRRERTHQHPGNKKTSDWQPVARIPGKEEMVSAGVHRNILIGGNRRRRGPTDRGSH